MIELLLFAHDHSADKTLPAAQLAALPKLYDLVTHQPAGWNWGKEELTSPWFRIVAWPDVTAAQLDSLLSPLPPSSPLPATPQFLGQYRGFFLNLSNAAILPAGFAAWLADASRVQPKWSLNLGDLNFTAAKIARTAIANPTFVGTTTTVIG